MQELAEASILPRATNDLHHTSQRLQRALRSRRPRPGLRGPARGSRIAFLPCLGWLSPSDHGPLPTPRPHSGRTLRGLEVLCVYCFVSLSRSSFLARIQPIIRQSLKGEGILPAQMTSCGLCRYLSRCGICLLGNAAGGSRFTRLESSI